MGGGRAGVVVDVPIGGCGCVVDGGMISQGRDPYGMTPPRPRSRLYADLGVADH
jgi:hypothetical protein